MANINNNTQAIVPIGAHVSVVADPAVSTVIPDNATGIYFTFNFAGIGNGYFKLDGGTAALNDGLSYPFTGPPIQRKAYFYTLNLYPGCPISFFATNLGTVEYQFFWTVDHKSLLTRT